MGQKEEIKIREADLGPVIARADHWDGAIEVNKDIFYGLPPMVQEFVLCHEVCHLKHNEYDEGRTNALASELFMSRAADQADREDRARFLSFMDTECGGYSNLDPVSITGIITSALSLGLNIYGKIKSSNTGWYSWSTDVKESNLKTMLKTAFEQSRRTNKNSASEFFWAQLSQYDFKDADLAKFLSRSDNSWVNDKIREYEDTYGFGFYEVTPIDWKAFPLLVAAIGIVIGIAVYFIVKKLKK